MATEDGLYRSSSQYRLWNFTPQKLATMRSKTNLIAREHVKSALKRAASSPSSKATNPDELDFLTPAEEQTLVSFFCLQLLSLTESSSQELPIPFPTTATAIQYIKRFYLTNSVLSYHPKQIMTTALYLATKTTNVHFSARAFAARIATIRGLESTTMGQILAPEHIIVQGMRFTFDVRHPHRALKGIYLELQMLVSLVRGDKPPSSWSDGKSAAQIAKEADHPVSRVRAYLHERYSVPRTLIKKIEDGYQRARDVLQRNALLSDAYFLYSPSIIAMAGLWVVDDKLVQHLLHSKMLLVKPSESRPSVDDMLDEIERCASELEAGKIDEGALRKEALRIDKKLHGCRNPEKVDLEGLNKARKRDGLEEGGGDEDKAKRRRLEREKAEREGGMLFGPELTK